MNPFLAFGIGAGVIALFLAVARWENRRDEALYPGPGRHRQAPDVPWSGLMNVPRPGESGGRAAEEPSLATMPGDPAGPGHPCPHHGTPAHGGGPVCQTCGWGYGWQPALREAQVARIIAPGQLDRTAQYDSSDDTVIDGWRRVSARREAAPAPDWVRDILDAPIADVRAGAW